MDSHSSSSTPSLDGKPYAWSERDEWGPEKVLQVYDPDTGMEGVLVIDNTSTGPGKGGIRFAESVTPSEIFKGLEYFSCLFFITINISNLGSLLKIISSNSRSICIDFNKLCTYHKN